MKFNPSTGTPLALGFQQDAEELMEEMESEDDNEKSAQASGSSAQWLAD